MTDDSRTRSAIERLHAAHAEQRYRDPALQSRADGLLQAVDRDCQSLDDAGRRGTLTRTLREAMTQFEVEHPKLTAAISEVVSALSGMGI